MTTPVRAAQYGFAERWLPRLVLAPSFLLTLVFLYGFIAWNGYLSFTTSRMLPNYEWAGLAQYAALFEDGGFTLMDFGVDAQFGHCVDGLFIADLHQLKVAKRQRYIGT